MDISIVGQQSIKIKGKKAAFIIDPAKGMPKTASDAIILLDGKKEIDLSRVTDYRTIIDGPGEYEIGGVKISGTKTPSGTLYRFSVDGVSVIIGYPTDAQGEGFNVCQVAVVNANIDLSESSFVTTLEPKISILYGEKKLEAAKTLGAGNTSSISKVTITKDKLPEKMEVVVLG